MHPLESQLAASWPPERWLDVTVVVAVSGGPDSVALLRAMHQLSQTGDRDAIREAAGRLIVAHFNHGWRGEDSELDQRFVQQLAAHLQLSCCTQRAELSSDRSEETARSQRYEFLKRTAHEQGARFVVTAHTRNDQIETVLHRILRGSGIAGLSGIPRVRELSSGLSLIRPMLPLDRAQVAAYLTEIDQSAREDASNQDPVFTRNRIRHELLPQLRSQFNPQVDNAVLRLSNLAGEYQSLIEALAMEQFERSVQLLSPECATIAIDPLRSAHSVVRRALLMVVWQRMHWPMQAMSEPTWRNLEQLITGERTMAITLPASVQATVDGGQLTLKRG